MASALELWEKPQAREIHMVAGWRQWADAGAVSSGLPEYLVQQTGARKIGEIRADGFYIFQIPATHDLLRPEINFNEGFPESLEARRNEIFYAGSEDRGLVIFIGDEPHLDIERYIALFLESAQTLGVKRIVGLGGVYGELPYDKDRMISSIYSLPEMKEEILSLSVTLSDYQGGASIESYICRRASEKGVEFSAFYAFVPTYDFSSVPQIGNTVRIENDYAAWLGVMRRVNHMLKLDIDLTDLQEQSAQLTELIEEKLEEIDQAAPDFDLHEYMARLSEEYTEMPFDPLDQVWEEELRRIMGKFDPDDADDPDEG